MQTTCLLGIVFQCCFFIIFKFISTADLFHFVVSHSNGITFTFHVCFRTLNFMNVFHAVQYMHTMSVCTFVCFDQGLIFPRRLVSLDTIFQISLLL